MSHTKTLPLLVRATPQTEYEKQKHLWSTHQVETKFAFCV